MELFTTLIFASILTMFLGNDGIAISNKFLIITKRQVSSWVVIIILNISLEKSK